MVTATRIIFVLFADFPQFLFQTTNSLIVGQSITWAQVFAPIMDVQSNCNKFKDMSKIKSWGPGVRYWYTCLAMIASYGAMALNLLIVLYFHSFTVEVFERKYVGWCSHAWLSRPSVFAWF